jgi:NAD(P)-dependent dehydrogenase (short-subunit alcohol dehydrogenase family)
MKLDMADRRALVTGASRGIGLAIARALLAEGALVAGAALDFPDEVPGLHTVRADLSQPDSSAAAIDAAVSALGGLDILVNNVGFVRPRVGGFLSVTDEDWNQTLNLNFLSAVRTTRAALPHLLEHGGSIVTIASVNARLPDPLVIDYSAAKGALLNFCKALSKQVAGQGVRVNTVSPGPVSTALWLGQHGVAATIGQATGAVPADIAAKAAAESPTGRFTTPEEVADLVLYLASGRAANITGGDFTIDGGLITTL